MKSVNAVIAVIKTVIAVIAVIKTGISDISDVAAALPWIDVVNRGLFDRASCTPGVHGTAAVPALIFYSSDAAHAPMLIYCV